MITNLTPIRLSITPSLFTLLAFLQIISCTYIPVPSSYHRKVPRFELQEREESIARLCFIQIGLCLKLSRPKSLKCSFLLFDSYHQYLKDTKIEYIMFGLHFIARFGAKSVFSFTMKISNFNNVCPYVRL